VVVDVTVGERRREDGRAERLRGDERRRLVQDRILPGPVTRPRDPRRGWLPGIDLPIVEEALSVTDVECMQTTVARGAGGEGARLPSELRGFAERRAGRVLHDVVEHAGPVGEEELDAAILVRQRLERAPCRREIAARLPGPVGPLLPDVMELAL